jgi:hypothetical protein
MNHDTFHGYCHPAVTQIHTKNMTDADMTQYLLDSAGVTDLGNAKLAYAAGYFESTILSLMARFPEVRAEIEDRVNFRKNSVGVNNKETI